MKYYIIAGERSGDLHGAALIRELKQKDTNAEFRLWGGDQMKSEAGEGLVKHYREMAFMGFLEVIKNIRTIKGFIKECKRDILAYKPDVVLLIDYPGFNLRIAKFAHQQHMPVHYYISPKVWAWNQKRALKIKKNIDKLYCIFPFEVDFYKQYDYQVQYVGNPLVPAVNNHPYDESLINKWSKQNVIAILPGSRKQELFNILPVLEELTKVYSSYKFLVAAVDNLEDKTYDRARELSNVEVIYDKTYEIVKAAKVAIVASGTATLETALIGTPQVVVYKTSGFSYFIAKSLIRVPYISLVNLVAGKEAVPELIQSDFTPENIKKWLDDLLSSNEDKRKFQLSCYTEIKEILGDHNTSLLVASEMTNSLK